MEVSICSSSEQAAIAERVLQDLRGNGIQVWRQYEGLPPGSQHWEEALHSGLQAVSLVIYLATPEARQSQLTQRELSIAMQYRLPIIPLWVGGEHWSHTAPQALANVQYIDARGERYHRAIEQLLVYLAPRQSAPVPPVAEPSAPLAPRPQATFEESYPLLARFDVLGFMGLRSQGGIPYILPPMCEVPGGKFTMGSPQDDPDATDEEKPQYRVEVGAFEIGMYPVTVAEYTLAVNAGAVPSPSGIVYGTGEKTAPNWRGKMLTWDIQQQRPDHPVVCVSWENARDYCRWLSTMTGQLWRLPREVEWEKAARWDAPERHSRIYPWGDDWDVARANTDEDGPGLTTPIGKYANQDDASPYDCHDMAGNVWEWTSTIWYKRPPYDAMASERDDDTTSPRVLRGGSWISSPNYARAAYRIYNWQKKYVSVGFRLVRTSAPSFFR